MSNIVPTSLGGLEPSRRSPTTSTALTQVDHNTEICIAIVESKDEIQPTEEMTHLWLRINPVGQC